MCIRDSVIKAAMEEANVTPDMAVGDICDAMEGAMTKIKVDGLTGTNMTWTCLLYTSRNWSWNREIESLPSMEILLKIFLTMNIM